MSLKQSAVNQSPPHADWSATGDHLTRRFKENTFKGLSEVKPCLRARAQLLTLEMFKWMHKGKLDLLDFTGVDAELLVEKATGQVVDQYRAVAGA